MKSFKFFQGKKDMLGYYAGRQINPDYYIIPQRIGQNRNNIIYEGWEAHRNNLPPGQCPYNIGTEEREWWLTGWSGREDREQPQDRMRWINVSVSNLRFEVYTHLSLGEIQHQITNIIEPFLFEFNHRENRELILRWLQSRFHRARILDSIEFDGITIPITHETI